MKLSYIELLGKQYPVCLSLTAYEKILEEFCSFEGMANALTSESELEVARSVRTLLPILMQAGKIYAAAIGEQVPPDLPCSPADLIDIRDPAAIRQIFRAVKNDTGRSVEAVPKNGEATPEP